MTVLTVAFGVALGLVLYNLVKLGVALLIHMI